MMKPRCYYARPITDYGTDKDNAIIADLSKVFEVNDPAYKQEMYRKHGMDGFRRIIESEIDILVYKTFDNGRIGAGVWKEIAWAKEAGLPVLQFRMPGRSEEMTVKETRDHLDVIRGVEAEK